MDTLEVPKISIVMIGRNAGTVIAGAIESVVRQDYQNYELVVVDGNSTDDTADILRHYQHVIARAISEPDDGISDALNKGIHLAKGEIVGIVHADDRLAEGALHCVARTYSMHQRPEVVHGNCVYWDPVTGEKILARPAVSKQSPFCGQFVKHGATFVAKSAYDRFGVFDKSYRCSMDYDLTLRLQRGGARFVHVDAVLAHIRMGGISMQMSRQTRRESMMIAIAHGCPAWRARLYFWRKTGKWFVKAMLEKSGLHRLITFYRCWFGRSKPFMDKLGGQP